jgi:hypothetical protein
MIELNNEKYYTTKEVTEKLGLSCSRISQLRKEGRLGFYEPSPKKYFYSEFHLTNYIMGKTKSIEIPGPSTQKEVLSQLFQLIDGTEDEFDKLIKDHEEKSFSSWKIDFLKDLTDQEKEAFTEEILRIIYVKVFRFSAWLKVSYS